MENVAQNQQKEYNLAKSPFSWDKLDGLLLYKTSLKSCAEILDTTDTTIKNHIKQRFDMTFTEYAQRKISKTKVKLVSKALEMATSGNTTMMIFCLKNICGWQDKIENENIDTNPIQIQIVKDNDRD